MFMFLRLDRENKFFVRACMPKGSNWGRGLGLRGRGGGGGCGLVNSNLLGVASLQVCKMNIERLP